ncbi:MAG: hypothetical protein IPL78_09565 [Chloroflexi bacterium]|nr:hypothetical protein [Chloroflexota bacterium]
MWARRGPDRREQGPERQLDQPAGRADQRAGRAATGSARIGRGRELAQVQVQHHPGQGGWGRSPSIFLTGAGRSWGGATPARACSILATALGASGTRGTPSNGAGSTAPSVRLRLSSVAI